ncbi:MAG: ABC transporter permease [Rhodospirillaceae bacterium]|jgi:peptide/nickel transport system permease protein|nr:ABC transporter permease [Rhodospirillaceae bacterium]MBT5564910.1 ABC transporter permease [Rhodospirillaceae bacterium]MBT6090549.1 ABC transporter permease [Rhodospirillaceae bacterium]MBT6959525.1 ABC transporter permease [Rhodospirillaceae bacterium]MBT7450023.1 ABC transporter permease [Rhodospirillaceae bacterium]
MTSFLIRRVGQAALVMVLVSAAAFLLFNYVGDPVNNLVGQEASFEDRQALRDRLGLNDSAPVQFIRFMGNALTGDFGISYRMQRPVSDLVAERLPATVELVLASALFSLLLGIPMGVYTAIHREGVLSRLVLSVSLIGVSLPTFVIGIGLIYLFSVTLGWLPSFGRGDTVSLGFWTTGLLTAGGLKALVLPAVTLGLFQMTFIQRLVRAEMIEVLGTDYIRTARAMGVPRNRVHYVYALKNTLLPVITVIGLKLGELIAFSIVTETVFQWPGLGLLFIQAVAFADIPIMAAYLVMVALVFVIINLAVDVLYAVVDPRLRTSRGASNE